jgi:uncharacterized membrane protein
MGKFFGNLHLVLAIGLVLAIALIYAFTGWTGSDAASIVDDVFRWLHLFFGITWIGLLYYLNFVQVPTMPKVPAELKKGVTGYIAPKVLFFFRYGALMTVLTGVSIAFHNGYGADALTFRGNGADGINLIGIGMWLALIMAFNVWFIIWPNQQKALGLVQASPEEKAAAGRTAMLTSRVNTALSIPMLFCMVAQQNAGL